MEPLLKNYKNYCNRNGCNCSSSIRNIFEVLELNAKVLVLSNVCNIIVVVVKAVVEVEVAVEELR